MTKVWLKEMVEEEAIRCHVTEIEFLEAFRECCPKDEGLSKLIDDVEDEFLRKV